MFLTMNYILNSLHRFKLNNRFKLNYPFELSNRFELISWSFKASIKRFVHRYFFLIFSIFTLNVFAPNAFSEIAQNPNDEFDQGAPIFDHKTSPIFSDADIQKRIEEEMKVACKGNLCEIVSAKNKVSGWTVSFNVGYGNNQVPNGGGTSVYLGDYSSSQSNKEFASITVSYKNFSCHSTIDVPPAIYRFVQTYFYNMNTPEGGVKRNFSPADQTVILFYTTILNKVSECRSFGSGNN